MATRSVTAQHSSRNHLRCFARTGIAAALFGLSLAASAAPLFTIEGNRAQAEQQLRTTNVLQVRVDQAALLAMAKGATADLVIPGAGTYSIVLDRIVNYGRDVKGWEGHIAGTQLRVTLSGSKVGISGDIATPAGKFRLGYMNGLQLLARDIPVSASAKAAAPQVLEVSRARTEAGVAPARGAMVADVNLVDLTALRPGERSLLSLPNGKQFSVQYDSALAGDGGNTTWVGHLNDYGTDFRVMLTYGPQGTMGTILTPDGEFKLQTVGASTWLIDVNRAGLVHAPQHEADWVVPHGAPTSTGAAKATLSTSNTASTTSVATAADTAGNTTIDLLILYTPGMVTRYGSALSTRLDQVVALANQAYVDSGVSQTVRRVAAVQVNYSDTATPSTALSALAGGSDPALAGVAQLRSQYGADLVTLVRPFNMQYHGGVCGVGYIGGYMGNPISNYSAYGYSVVGDGTDVGGSSYYCTEFTLAHELGHNMGSMHDRATVSASSTPTAYGAYNYGFGYGVGGSFGTVMSYISPRVGKFSNPLVTTCGSGLACGVSETNTASSANNALSLNNTKAAVAAFMPTAGAATVTISGMVSSGRKALSGVAVSGNGATCTSSGSNGVYSCTVPSGWSGSLVPSRSGYAFTPASRTYTSVNSAQTGQNYAATRVQ